MNKITARTIRLNLKSNNYQSLLKDGKNTAIMNAGLVTLEPGKSVGKHSTENKEEIIIVLEGVGKFIFDNGKELKLKYGYITYCPSHTEHNVVNTGKSLLKYMYVVSKIK